MFFFSVLAGEKNERHGFSSLVHLLFFFLQKYGIVLQHFFFYTFHFWLCFGASANGPCSLIFFFSSVLCFVSEAAFLLAR